MTTWQSKPLAAMSLWDYDDLQVALEANPVDTLPKLIKRLFEFLTKFPDGQTDLDLVGETAILLNRVGAWSRISSEMLAPILSQTNKKTRDVLLEELPLDIALNLNRAMDKELSKKRAEEQMRFASYVEFLRQAQLNEEKRKSTVDLVARTLREHEVSASPLAETLVRFFPERKIVYGGVKPPPAQNVLGKSAGATKLPNEKKRRSSIQNLAKA